MYSWTFGGPVAVGGGLAFRSHNPECLLFCMDFFKKVLAEEGSANFVLIIPRQKYRPQCR
jgi:hypothetical protein